MQYALFALPIVAGKGHAARAFLTHLDGDRKAEYSASEKRLEISKELWAIQESPVGELFVVFFQGDDVGGAIQQFVASQDGFDQWFKGQVKETTGVDLNVPPPGPLSEILSVYEV